MKMESMKGDLSMTPPYEPQIRVEPSPKSSTGYMATMTVHDVQGDSPRGARVALMEACALYLQRYAVQGIRQEEE